ncbi:MAG: hypothetical protein ABI451_11790 [Dokdonella sp.]
MMAPSRTRFCLAVFALVAVQAAAQTTLPDVVVKAPPWETEHGGYKISSNFQVDTHMSAVVYPAEPFEKDDILSVSLSHMHDDEYFVLQECSSQDCTQAHILRVWNAYGALGVTVQNENRVWIPHEGKFFMWMQRFPMRGFSTGPFTGFKAFSPPMVLEPIGTSEQFHVTDVVASQEAGPVKVVSSDHDGASFVIRFAGGTSVLVKRMRALN